MELGVVSPTDPFCRRKCEACRRLALPGQAVFTSFFDKRESGNSWFVLHLTCLRSKDESLGRLIRSMASDLELALGAGDRERVEYFDLREQILTTKEAFPNAAA